MICYLDKTFCCNPDCTCGEYRRLTYEVRAAAEKLGLPICFGDMCGAKPAVTP